MTSLRDIVILLTKNDIYLVLIWILTEVNELTDDLSRFWLRRVINMYL